MLVRVYHIRMCVYLRWPFGGNFSPHLVGGGQLPVTRNMSAIKVEKYDVNLRCYHKFR